MPYSIFYWQLLLGGGIFIIQGGDVVGSRDLCLFSITWSGCPAFFVLGPSSLIWLSCGFVFGVLQRGSGGDI